MINYPDLYELVRKEKTNDVLQGLPADFLSDMALYLQERRDFSMKEEGLFKDEVVKQRKQFENSLALFKELMTRRKKKLLSLVFVATETGIMKRDYEHMLVHERRLFDDLVQASEQSERTLQELLQGTKVREVDTRKLVIFTQPVTQFVSMTGEVVGPFSAGELAQVDASVAQILVGDSKATFADA